MTWLCQNIVSFENLGPIFEPEALVVYNVLEQPATPNVDVGVLVVRQQENLLLGPQKLSDQRNQPLGRPQVLFRVFEDVSVDVFSAVCQIDGFPDVSVYVLRVEIHVVLQEILDGFA